MNRRDAPPGGSMMGIGGRRTGRADRRGPLRPFRWTVALLKNMSKRLLGLTSPLA